MDLSFHVDETKEKDFSDAFLAAHPVPLDKDGAPLFTDLEWIRQWGIGQYNFAYDQGRRKIFLQQGTGGEGIMS